MSDPKKEQDVSRYSWSKRGMVHWPIGFGRGAQFVDYGDYCSEREARKQSEAENDMCVNQLGEAEERAARAEAERDRMREAIREFFDDWDYQDEMSPGIGTYYIDNLRAALTAPPAPEERETPPAAKVCRWTVTAEKGPAIHAWRTSCKHWEGALNRLPLKSQEIIYCRYCGKPIEEVKEQQEEGE